MATDIYLPEDPDYTLVDSVRDSVRFAHYCVEPLNHGHWCAPSSAVDSNGKPVEGHALAHLEGPGGQANAVGGALTLYRWARFDQNHILEKVAVGLLDHVMEDGFLTQDGPIWSYRDTDSGAFFLDAERDSGWCSPPDQARSALQLLWWSDELPAGDMRMPSLRNHAARIGEWILTEPIPVSGWLSSQRCTVGSSAPAAGADGLYVVWLLMEMSERGLGEQNDRAHNLVETFVRSGGIYGRGKDQHKVADTASGRALAFRVLRRAARHFRNPTFGEFGIEDALAGLQRFIGREDRNGLPTMGLLVGPRGDRMACMADNAECALAYIEAAEDTGEKDHLCMGVTILRAIARFHHTHAEPHGFLAMGLDLDSARDSIPETPIPGAFTHPLYDNLLHVDAALHYLSRRVI